MLLLPNASAQLRYSETSLTDFCTKPVRLTCGLYMAVVSGTATLYADAEVYQLQPQMELSYISGCAMRCANASADFRVVAFTFTSELLTKIALPLDSIYFDYSEAHHTHTHTAEPRSQRTWHELLTWMDLAKALFAQDAVTKFPQMQQENFLQGFWMWMFSTIQGRLEPGTGLLGTQLTMHRFLRMVKTDALRHHRADYYAQRLNISQRYLNKIVWKHSHGKTPKRIIDAQVVAEIKERLANPSLSVTQVAYLCHFPDQSYMSRFFSRHTGLSPQQYRQQRSSRQ